MTAKRRLYTTGDLCDIFLVNRQTVMRWVKLEKIPADKVVITPGGSHRFDADYIDSITHSAEMV